LQSTLVDAAGFSSVSPLDSCLVVMWKGVNVIAGTISCNGSMQVTQGCFSVLHSSPVLHRSTVQITTGSGNGVVGHFNMCVSLPDQGIQLIYTGQGSFSGLLAKSVAFPVMLLSCSGVMVMVGGGGGGGGTISCNGSAQLTQGSFSGLLAKSVAFPVLLLSCADAWLIADSAASVPSIRIAATPTGANADIAISFCTISCNKLL
jgi:hypothetical protein